MHPTVTDPFSVADEAGNTNVSCYLFMYQMAFFPISYRLTFLSPKFTFFKNVWNILMISIFWLVENAHPSGKTKPFPAVKGTQ